MTELKNWEKNKRFTEMKKTRGNLASQLGGSSIKKLKMVKTSPKQDFPTEVGIYTIFALIVSNQWEIKSIDVKTAFLQTKQIERTIYLHSPMEANKSNI